MLNNTLRLIFRYLKIIRTHHPQYHPKIIGHFLKNKRNSKCVCINDIIRLITMKINIKVKKRSRRYDLNRSRSKQGHKYSICKKCLFIIMLHKQHLKLNSWKGQTILMLSWRKDLIIKKACSKLFMVSYVDDNVNAIFCNIQNARKKTILKKF